MHRMSTQKRRIVYISDEQWTWLTGYAKAAGISASEIIRDAIELTRTGRATRIVEVPVAYPEFRPVPKPGKGR